MIYFFALFSLNGELSAGSHTHVSFLYRTAVKEIIWQKYKNCNILNKIKQVNAVKL